MLVRMTNSQNKTDIFIKPELIRSVEKSPKNLLQTIVITNLMTPQGLVTYEVSETPEEIARRIEIAQSGKSAILQ